MKARQRMLRVAAGLAALTLAATGSDFMLHAGNAATLGMLGSIPALLP